MVLLKTFYDYDFSAASKDRSIVREKEVGYYWLKKKSLNSYNGLQFSRKLKKIFIVMNLIR
jgi:hypothetical protein